MFHENIKNEKSKFHGLEIYDLWVADYSGKIDLPFGWKDWIGHQNTDNYMKSFDHNYFKKEWVDKYKQG